MTKEQAKLIVEQFEIGSSLECEGEDLKENCPDVYEAYQAIVEFAK